MQSAAYAIAHNQIYGTNITKGVILVCTPDLYFQRFIVEGAEFQDYAKQWLAKVAQSRHQTHPTPVSYTHLTLPTIYSV